MVCSLRRRIAITVILRVRTSVSGFALPELRKENLELLPLSAWGRDFSSILAKW